MSPLNSFNLRRLVFTWRAIWTGKVIMGSRKCHAISAQVYGLLCRKKLAAQNTKDKWCFSAVIFQTKVELWVNMPPVLYLLSCFVRSSILIDKLAQQYMVSLCIFSNCLLYCVSFRKLYACDDNSSLNHHHEFLIEFILNFLDVIDFILISKGSEASKSLRKLKTVMNLETFIIDLIVFSLMFAMALYSRFHWVSRPSLKNCWSISSIWAERYSSHC